MRKLKQEAKGIFKSIRAIKVQDAAAGAKDSHNLSVCFQLFV